MPKLKKKTCCENSAGRFNEIDMFGSNVNFNIDGRRKYNSCLGSCCTLLILVVVACYAVYQMEHVFVTKQVPIINTQIREGFYDDRDVLRQDEGDFTFAVAVTNHTKFDSLTAENFLQYGQFLMKYTITGGEEDGKVFQIAMEACTDDQKG